MEEKRVTINAWETDDGKLYIHSKELVRELGKEKKIYFVDNTNDRKIIKVPFSPFNGEYVDNPVEEYEGLHEFDDKEKEEGKMFNLVNCIKDGTSILFRRNGKGGPKK